MRVVRVVPSLDPGYGGPAVHVAATSAALAARGHEVVVVTGDAGDLGAGAPYRVVATGPRRTPYGWSQRLTSAVVAEASTADVLVVHGLWEHTSYAALRATASGGPPLAVVPHGMLDPWIVARTRVRRAVRGTQARLLDGRLLRRADRVLFTSEAEHRAAVVTVPAVDAVATVIRYGTADPGPLGVTPKVGRTSEGPVRFGMLGRYHPKKRADLAVAALADPALASASLRLVGPESAEMASLRATVRDRGLDDRVQIDGPVYGVGRFEVLRDLDWLVLPSMQENFAQVVTEALSVGTPVVLSSKVNIAQEVQGAGAGLVCEPDAASLAAAMAQAQAEVLDGRYDQRTRAARLAYEERYDLERSVDDLEAVLGGLAR